MEEIAKFDLDSEGLSDDLHKCMGDLQMVELSKRQNGNKISELQIELEDTIERMQNAKASRQKEIENIEQKIIGSQNGCFSLHSQIQETEVRISDQHLYITSLKEKISDAEYVLKRKSG